MLRLYKSIKTLIHYVITLKYLTSGAKSEMIEGKLSDLLARTKIEEAENLNVTEWRGKKESYLSEKKLREDHF